MNLKTKCFEVGFIEGVKPEYISLLFTPQTAWDIKTMLEEKVYKSKYKGKREDHSSFTMMISGYVKDKLPEVKRK